MSDIKDKDKDKKESVKKIIPGYITYPLTEIIERDPDSKTTIPTLSAVAELRDWSEHNKK